MDSNEILESLRTEVEKQGYFLNDERALEIYEGYKRIKIFAELNEQQMNRYCYKEDIDNYYVILEIIDTDIEYYCRFIDLVEFATDYKIAYNNGTVYIYFLFSGFVF